MEATNKIQILLKQIYNLYLYNFDLFAVVCKKRVVGIFTRVVEEDGEH